MTAVLNAANERANELFRGEKLGYLGKKLFHKFNCFAIYHIQFITIFQTEFHEKTFFRMG